MSHRKRLTIIVLTLLAALLAVIPAAAKAITETVKFEDVTVQEPDVDFCGAGAVTLTITYDGVMHTTTFTDDDPNAGTFHGMLKLHGAVIAVGQDGNLVSEDHFVKTIFHTNANRRNANDNFNFIVSGKRADGGSHHYHLVGHASWSAGGNPVTFEKVSISCP